MKSNAKELEVTKEKTNCLNQQISQPSQRVQTYILKTEEKYVIKEVATLQAMGALISKEADSMSALKFRMNKADKALWMDMKLHRNKVIAEGR